MPSGDYIEVDGPVNQSETLIEYDVPFAPNDPKKSLKLRQKLGLIAETRTVDPNIRIVIDSFITPRTWEDDGVRWVQHASPYPAARIHAVHTRTALSKLMANLPDAKKVGICPGRSNLYSQCFLEVIRQVTVECWERGLLLLKVYSDAVETQKYHREMFESRCGYAFRLALKGEKDTMSLVAQVDSLKERAAALAKEEAELRQKCDCFAAEAEEQLLIDEKKRSAEISVLKKEANIKKNQLEALTTPIPKV
eukprot:Tbor_TRINITY_DN2299_c0_g1::TRINITY_DN2299_c0_g1_i1::g.2742::m.2742/K10410/DNALI; dynein light intermediate chain, axonemal